MRHSFSAFNPETTKPELIMKSGETKNSTQHINPRKLDFEDKRYGARNRHPSERTRVMDSLVKRRLDGYDIGLLYLAFVEAQLLMSTVELSHTHRSVVFWVPTESIFTMLVAQRERVNFVPISKSKYWNTGRSIRCHEELYAPDQEIGTILHKAPSHQAPPRTIGRWRHLHAMSLEHFKNYRRDHRRFSEAYKRAMKGVALTSLPPLNDTCCEADRTGNSDDTETLNIPNLYSRGKCGSQLLTFWKGTAGKSKSWRRLPVTTIRTYKKRDSRGRRRQSNTKKHSSQVLPLPRTFLRARQGKSYRPIEYDTQHRALKKRPKQENHLDYGYIRYDYTGDIIWEDRGVETYDGTNGAHQTTDQNNELEPGNVFIRLTWNGWNFINLHEQIGRFLPSSLRFRNGWYLGSFLRDENFTYVYSVSPENDNVRHHPKLDLEAHVYVTGWDGRLESYAKRHKNRMRNSGNCLDTFWYDDRHIFIMSVPQAPHTFRLQNNESEFPYLNDQKVWAEKAARGRRELRRMPTYAAVLRILSTPVPVAGFANHPDTAYAKEMAEINRMTTKKRLKQQSKRHAQRGSKKLYSESHGC